MADEFKDALVKDVTERLKEIFKDGIPVHLMPNTDLVPVVRCKDCKHWAMHSWCSRLAPFDKVYMGTDDYCSKGKRRDEVEE